MSMIEVQVEEVSIELVDEDGCSIELAAGAVVIVNAGGGGSYTPGDGIKIVGQEISVDRETVLTPEGIAAMDADVLSSAQNYANSQAGAALSSAQIYTDSGDVTTLNSANAHADSGDAATLVAVKSYADGQDVANLIAAENFATSADAAVLTAAKAYADAQGSSAIKLCTAKVDASTGLFPTTGGHGTGGAIQSGDMFFIGTPGTIQGVAYDDHDSIIALRDNPGQDATLWANGERNIGYTPENVANKVTTLSGNNPNTFPNVPAVNSALALKANALAISVVGFSGNYNDLLNLPIFSTVATSGSYLDLSNRPFIPAAQVQSDWNASSGIGVILNKPTLLVLGSATPQSLATTGSAGSSANAAHEDHAHPLPTLAALGAAAAVTFNQSRWKFYDFDSAGYSGYNFAGLGGTTTSNNSLITTSTDLAGVTRIIGSSNTTGGGIYDASSFTSGSHMGVTGLIARLCFRLLGSVSDRTMTFGFNDQNVISNGVSNYVGLRILNLTATGASRLTSVGNVRTYGSVALPNDTDLICDIEYLATNSVRICVFNRSTLTKYLDVNANTDIPAGSALAMFNNALVVGTGALAEFDYIGCGNARPSFIVTPP